MPTPTDNAPFDDEARRGMDAKMLASATSKPKKSGLSGCTIVAIILCGLWLVGYLGSSPKSAPTATNAIPLSNITLAEIVAHRENDTDLQWKSYEPTIVGKRVLWKGTVSDVTEGGNVDLDVSPAPLTWSVLLEGLPKDTVILMNKGQALQVEATIQSVSGLLGFTYVRLSSVVLR